MNLIFKPSEFKFQTNPGLSQPSFEQPGPAMPIDYFTWSHRLSKRQSLSTTTVLFRTTFTWTIKLNLLLKWLLGSNLSQWFVVIFGINTTSDISKLLYVISRTVRRVKFETILKYHKWYLCQILRTNHAVICLYYYPQKVCYFTCRFFKLSWTTPALSQSNCRNFSWSSMMVRN